MLWFGYTCAVTAVAVFFSVIVYNNSIVDVCCWTLFCCQIPVLISELIATEIWKEKVFPKFLDLQLEQELLFPIYIVVGIYTCLL